MVHCTVIRKGCLKSRANSSILSGLGDSIQSRRVGKRTRMSHSKLPKVSENTVTAHSSLSLLERYGFASLVPEGLRDEFVHGGAKGDELIRCGLKISDQVVAVACVRARQKKGQLVHFYVSKPYRRRGLGTRLMSVVEERLRAEGVEEVFAEYRRETQKGQQFADFLASAGFQNPELQRVKVRISTPQIKKAAWWQPDRDPPRDFAIRSWADLSAEERENLARKNWVPDVLNPVQVNDADEGLSNVLCYRGDVVGWFLMTNNGDGLFSIPSAYIAPAHQKRFRLGLLIYATLDDAMRVGMEQLDFVVPGAFPSHIRFNETHTQALAEKFYYICSRVKKRIDE